MAKSAKRPVFFKQWQFHTLVNVTQRGTISIVILMISYFKYSRINRSFYSLRKYLGRCIIVFNMPFLLKIISYGVHIVVVRIRTFKYSHFSLLYFRMQSSEYLLLLGALIG